MIKEDILNAIKANNQFDGTYYELYLEKPFFMNAEEEVIRVMADNENDGDIIVHVMNQSDESRFVPFDMLDNERQINVYAEVCKSCDNVIGEYYTKYGVYKRY